MAWDPVRESILHDEDFKLDAEDTSFKLQKGHVILRTMTDFEFRRDDSYVAPLWEDCTKEFWKRVSVRGFAASLSGASRHLVQAGHWDPIYSEAHHEVYEITEVVGLTWESRPEWRGGLESTFWLETKKYSYALQLPEGSFEDTWRMVLKSWEKVTGADGWFRQISHTSDQPSWCTIKRAWRALVKRRTQEDEDALEDEPASEEDDAPASKGQARGAKGKTMPEGSDRRKGRVPARGKGKERAESSDSQAADGTTEVDSVQPSPDVSKGEQSSDATREESTTKPRRKSSRKSKKAEPGPNMVPVTVCRNGPNSFRVPVQVYRKMTEKEIEQRDMRQAKKEERRREEEQRRALRKQEAVRQAQRQKQMQSPEASHLQTSSTQPTGSKRKADVLASTSVSGSHCGEEPECNSVPASPPKSSTVERPTSVQYEMQKGRVIREADGCTPGPSTQEAASMPQGTTCDLFPPSSSSSLIGPQDGIEPSVLPAEPSFSDSPQVASTQKPQSPQDNETETHEVEHQETSVFGETSNADETVSLAQEVAQDASDMHLRLGDLDRLDFSGRPRASRSVAGGTGRLGYVAKN